jgi:hypothetical protein
MNANPRFVTLALVLALAFVALFVSLLWLVRQASLARGSWVEEGRREDKPTPAPRATIRVGPRAVGVLVVLAGCGFVVWSWNEAHAGRMFSFKMATMGPLLIGVGVWAIVEGPEMPTRRVTPLGWILSGIGLLCGFLYAEFLRVGRLPFGL